MPTSDNDNKQPAPADSKTLLPLWRRVVSKSFKWLFGIVISVILLAVAAIGTGVFILSPERLTPMVGKIAAKYLNADVGASRIELYFWSTFPKVNLEVDSLVVVSKAFDNLDPQLRAQLPANADTLAMVRHFRGGINLMKLVNQTVSLSDVEIDGLTVNAVKADSLLANYDITASADSAAESSGVIPLIEINRFVIAGRSPLTYVSVPDSTDVCITLTNTDLNGEESPRYHIDIAGNGDARIGGIAELSQLPFAVDGFVKWSPMAPDNVSVSDFKVEVDSVGVMINAEIGLADSLLVKTFELTASQVSVGRAVNLGSKLGLLSLEKFETDLTVDLRLALDGEYGVASGAVPALIAEITVPEGKLSYDRMSLSRFTARMRAAIPSRGLDYATVEIDRLLAVGRAVGFDLKGSVKADGNLADPVVACTFKGGVGFDGLPRQLLDRLPFALKGRLTGEAGFKFRPSNLTANRFHKLNVDGNIKLSDFDLAMRDSSMQAYSRLATLDFGTHSSYRNDSIAVDSLLSLRLAVDTVNYFSRGIRFTGNDLQASLTGRNTETSFDTTVVTPLAARIAGKRLIMNSDSDSVSVRLRDIEIKGMIRRFEGNNRRPLVALSIGARRLAYRDRFNRLSLVQAGIGLQLHPRKRPRLGRTALAVYDSLSYLYPNLPVDSVYALTQEVVAERRRRRREARAAAAPDSLAASSRHSAFAADSHENDIDFGVDNSIQSWLKLWEATGTVKARRGRLFTPYFPVTNRLDSLDVAFSTDSVIINHAHYRSGRTSLTLDGSIRNITSAVTSKRGAPINIAMNLRCDTLDINSFAEAAFAGSNFAQRSDSLTVFLPDSDNDDELQRSVEQSVSDSVNLAFVVPSNVSAKINLSARQVLYADVWFRRLKGAVDVANGAVHLNRLAGYTDIGTIDITMLYSAPNLSNIDFAGGIVVRKLDLRKFLHMMPQVDSLLPLLRHIEGIVTADIAMTSELDSLMDFKFNTLKAAMKLDGDSLVLMDSDTFRKISKWLMFKQKNKNMIDHMSVELLVNNSYLQMMPFEFDLDRYKLGVWGGNDLDMNYDYHIAVLKSPLPFKFGVTIKGHGDDFRFKLGKANFDPQKIIREQRLTDTTRINLIDEIKKVFDFGVKTGRSNRKIVLSGENAGPLPATEFESGDSFTHADSVLFMQEGVIPMTPEVADSIAAAQNPPAKQSKRNKSKKRK